MIREERSEELTFEYPFTDCHSEDSAGRPNCGGWSTRGKYNTRLTSDGAEILDFALSVIAPEGF